MEQCTNCGAQLHLAAPGGVTVCQYCGAQRREPAPPPVAPPAPNIDAHEPRHRADADAVPVNRSPLAIAGGVIGAIAVGTVALVSLAPDNHAGAKSSAAAATAAATTTDKPKLTLANLATTPFSYEAIDAPGMVGSFSQFDPIVNLEWVRAIGRAWRVDAVFYRLDIDRVAKDGLIDVKSIPGAQAMYRFVSPKCKSDKAASTSVVVSPLKCGMNVLVMKQEGAAAPEVIVDAVDGDSANPAEVASPACTLSKAFAALEKAGKLPAKPVFNAWILSASDRAHKSAPEWVFGDIQGGSIADVDGTSCALR